MTSSVSGLRKDVSCPWSAPFGTPPQSRADDFVELMRGWRPDSEEPTQALEALGLHGVEFLVVGGAATAIHAQPRYTDDLDLWVRQTDENLARLRRALEVLPYEVVRPDTAPKTSILLRNHKVDLFRSQWRIEFAEAWRRRVEPNMFDLTLSFVGLVDLVRIKRAVDQNLDSFDLCVIEEIHGKVD